MTQNIMSIVITICNYNNATTDKKLIFAVTKYSFLQFYSQLKSFKSFFQGKGAQTWMAKN